MTPRLIAFFKRPTSRHVIINTLGNYLNVFFYAFFAWILVRILTPSQYGVLSVLLGIAYVLANVLDFGTTATIYSYLPALIEKKDQYIYRFIKSTVYYQSIFSLIVIIILLISFPFLDQVFFKTHAPQWWLYITAISVLFLIWQNFALNILFAAKKFLHANIYLNLSNFLKTAVILLLMTYKSITVGTVLFVFGILGPLIFFLFLFIVKKDIIFVLLKSEVKREDFRFGYTLTYFAASQFQNLGLRMDLFLLSNLRTQAEVGYYGLSQKIILTIITTIISITQVLSPGFSKIDNKKEAKSQLKTGFLYLLVPSALFLTLFFLPNSVYELFFTEKFAQTALITKALSIPFIIFSLSNLPILFILYTAKKPIFILIANVVFFAAITIGCYLLIPKMGVYGPPWAIGTALVMSTLTLIFYTIKEYKKLPS
ncbi:MAG: oligosaccharide flippase family protein [Candidatus Roizmanbacteria bacterium]|nr:MAG: oligosaccharide flippase family protein [Candidatus Roizmanbacteria bacterium]